MDAGIERALRIEWSLSIIAKLVDTGRNEGWLAGEALGAREEVVAPQIPRGPLPTPMQHLRERLELSSLALDVLWFLACVELDPRVSQGAAVLNVMATELSVQMLGQLLDLDSEPGLLDELTELGLLELQSEPTVPIFRRAVRVSDRVLDLARDHIGLDRSLRGIAALASASEIRESHRALALELPVEVQSTIRLQSRTLLVATGSEGSGRRTLLNYAIAAGGFAALSVRVDGLATDADVLQRQLRAIARECLLHRAWPMLLGIDRAEQRMPIIERTLLSGVASPVFATAHEGAAYSMSRPVVTVPVERPTATARAAMWRSALPGASENVIADCAERYSVTPGLIVQSARSATALVGDVTRVDTHKVHVALRTHLDRSLSGLARRIETRQDWSDLVLPPDQFDLLIELVARVKHRSHVLETWGFAEKVGRGLGLAALLSGPPGTGKTMIAGLIARELELDLYQVDLSKIVSKYIGETEKQLAQVFDAAESGHAILLFDEADSLFGKRTDVKGSNDRYANLEVNYLLQRVEAFSGITLLTTNHETAIDQAFLRRLAFHVRVPMPEEEQREMLWRSMLPSKAACDEGVDFAGLASEFVMSGGYVKNAVLRAAFLAADAGSPISNDHMWRAARAEYDAMGKVAVSR